MSWIRHRRPNFSLIFPHFSSISTPRLIKTLDKRPRTCATHGIHVAVHTPRSQVPPSLTWLMHHQPALITCLHSRPCFWTLGPRPLSIVPTISVRSRLPPISYHPCKFSHWATYALGIPIAIAPLFFIDPQPVLPLSYYSSSIVLSNPFVPLSDNGSRSTIVLHSIYTCTVASPGPHLDLLVFGPRYAFCLY